MNTKKDSKVYQLKILLRDTKVWRKILVKSDILLPELHKIIQTVMGWTNSHLHHFIIDNAFYCIPDGEDYGLETVDYEKVKLGEVKNRIGDRFIYEYDFGDSWEHEIEIEKILPVEKGKYYPACLDGKNACPPEDCGGTGGFEDFLKAIKDKEHPEHEEFLEWIGGEYDSEYFNIEEVNEMLKEKDYGCITLFD